jgi:hypothetical protein
VRPRHRRLFLATALLTIGCKSGPAKVTEQLEQSVSWIATLETVAHSWSENRVPSRYAERTIEEGSAALASADQPRAARIAAGLADVVRNRDQTEMAVHLEALRQERSALEARLDRAKHGQ